MADETPDEIVERALSEPQQVSGDQGNFVNRPIGDIIKAAEKLDRIKARKRGGIVYRKLKPPSARGE